MFRFSYSYPYCTSFSKQNVLPKSHLLCYFDIIKYKTLYRNLIRTSAHVFIYLILIHAYIAMYFSPINTYKKGLSKFREAFYLVRLAGFEPAHPVPETGALSPEL